MTYAWLLGEPLRRLTGQRPGQAIADSICQPLGMDFFIGVPDQDLERIASVSRLRGNPTA